MLQVQIIGHVGKDPEASFTPNGVAVTKFSVATSKKDKDGKEETTWLNCTAWRQMAETINQYVRKGQMLFVQGELTPRSYTTREGKQGMSLDVNVSTFQLLGAKPQAQGTPNNSSELGSAQQNT